LLDPTHPDDPDKTHENTANPPSAALNEAGRELCAQLFAQTPPEIDKS